MAIGSFSIVAGREFSFAPKWDCSDATVVFDRNSGDYWVISAFAQALVRLVQARPNIDLTTLAHFLSHPDLETGLTEDLTESLGSLINSGLLKSSK